MIKRLFRSTMLVALIVLLLSIVLFMGTLYRYYSDRVILDLQDHAEMVARGLEMRGAIYLLGLDLEDSRITWITSSGDVLYESQDRAYDMDNHANRPEIRDALTYGTGMSIRQSDTLGVQSIYYAIRLDDGTVLRVSCDQAAVWGLLVSMLPWVGLILLLALLLSAILSMRLAQRIIRPITELDLDHPENWESYEELNPLISRLHLQQNTIRSQLEALERQRRELAAVTDNMAEGLLLLDSEGNLLSWNPSALSLLGASHAERGSNVLLLDREETFYHSVENALSGQHSEALLERNGRCLRLLASGVEQEGHVMGAVLLILDVTESEHWEQLRREFTANVSHELKTPLTSISGFAELMQSGLVPTDRMVEFSSNIYQEAQRLMNLVNDIIRISQLDEGASPTGTIPVDLRAAAEETARRLAPAAQAKGVTITVEGPPVTVEADPAILNEIVWNLCDNAVKYNRSGGSVRLIIDAGPGLTVADTGIGIPSEHQSRVFERFYRVDKSRSKEMGGTGLGLSIVKHGAAALGAKISLKSQVNRGTTIRVFWN